MRLILEQNKDSNIFIQNQSCELCEDRRPEVASETTHPLYLTAVSGNVTIVKLLLAYNIHFKDCHLYCRIVCPYIVFTAVKN